VTTPLPAALLLEDGRTFEGFSFGHPGETAGEVVFNTALTGYQEILTDPSYRAQIITFTYPHIGNYGVNPADMESGRIQAAGLIVRAPCPEASNWRAAESLDAWLGRNGVVGLWGIDTRALVRHIRTAGAMRGAIVAGDPVDRARLEARLAAEPPMVGRDLIDEVTCAAPYEWIEGLHRLDGEARTRPQAPRPDRPFHVVAFDYGIKRNMLRLLVDHGCRVTVVPARTPAADVLALKPDGVFLSNGPGDPAALDYAVDTIRGLIGQVPLFGICLGHQLLARALGGRTFKLPFGHRGANQPVLDVETGKVEITSQNHGFAVDADSIGGDARVTHVNLNDRTVEGLGHAKWPLFSVQYHPEAAPGPHDADYLFRRFTRLMEAHR
jgi:carbamoyl-phosphate synthase small subunit